MLFKFSSAFLKLTLAEQFKGTTKVPFVASGEGTLFLKHKVRGPGFVAFFRWAVPLDVVPLGPLLSGYPFFPAGLPIGWYMLGWYIFSLSLWKPEEKKDSQGDTVYVKTVKEETERDEYVNKAKAKKSGQMTDDGFKALEDSLDNWITMDQPSSSNLAIKDGKKIRKN